MQGERRHRPVAIVDIGSNSIRMVVYDGQSRTPVPIFNEKATCALGAGLAASNRLNPEGVPQAFAAIGRFVRLAKAMQVERVDILATAAVRDAVDGPAFVEELQRSFDITVQVLSGGQEAELAALGVLCGHPEAEGVVADLGGGSLELITLRKHEIGQYTTMPLGVLRLQEGSEGDRAKASEMIDRYLENVPWLAEARGQDLHAVGGAWRAIARICIAQTEHPLLVLDNFTLRRDEAEAIIDLVSRQSKKSLEKMKGVPKRRAAALPMAALLLEKLLIAMQPEKLIFSVYGMREGQFYNQLPPEIRDQDPLLSACVALAREAGRFPEHGQEVMDWLAPLFAEETEGQKRLRLAACTIGDVFWNEHPDYRAEQSLLKVLRLPFMGLNHRDRAELALAIYTRYDGAEDGPVAIQAKALLDEPAVDRAIRMGMALRLGYSISAGLPDLLRSTQLRIEPDCLVLDVPGRDPAFQGEVPDKRYERLAKTLGLDAFLLNRI